MASTRLRQGFRYVGDDDESVEASESAEILDEQEQEIVIRTLAGQSQASSRTYQLAFLWISAFTTICYSFALLRLPFTYTPHATSYAVWFSLGLASTLCSAFGIWDIDTGIETNDRISRSLKEYLASLVEGRRWLRQLVSGVRRHIVPTNGTLFATLVLLAYTGSSTIYDRSILLLYLISPALVSLGMLLIGQRELQLLDTKNLEKLKYNFKGA